MRFIFFLFFFLLSFSIHAQQKEIDSLKVLLNSEKNDSLKILIYYDIAKKNAPINQNEFTTYFNKGIQLSQKRTNPYLFQLGINEYAIQLFLKGEYQKAISILDNSIASGSKMTISNEFARSNFIKGSVLNGLKDYTGSINQYKIAFSLFKFLGNNLRLGNISQNIGNNYFSTGNLENAIKYYFDAIEYYEKVNNNEGLAQIYSNLGVINVNQKNFDIAAGYYKKAIQIYTILKNQNGILLINNNISSLYHGQKKYVEAIPILKQNLSLSKQINNTKIETATLSTLASCYERLGDTLNATLYFNELFNALGKYKDNEALIIAYNNYAMFLSGLNKIDNAIDIQKNAIDLAKSDISFKKFLHSLYATMSAFYAEKKDFSTAFSFKDSQFIYKENIINETANAKLLELQTKYETSQKENKIKLLSREDSINNLKILNQQLLINKANFQLTQQKLALTGAQLRLAEDSLLLFSQNEIILNNQLEAALKTDKINELTKTGLRKELVLQKQESAIKQKNATILIIVILALLLSLTGFVFYKKKQIEQKRVFEKAQAKQREDLAKAVIEAEESERKRIAGDLHDGIGQLFSAVKMNLNGLLERVDLPKTEDKFLAEKTLALVEESCKEVRVLSHKMMPNFLLKSGIASDIRSFIEKIDEQKLKIHFESIGFKDQLEFNEEVILYRVIQELINNVIKHANANELGLILEKTSHQISVILTDNGVGFNYEEGKAKDGLGLKNILIRVAYLKGNIQFSPNMPSGTKVQITIPIT